MKRARSRPALTFAAAAALLWAPPAGAAEPTPNDRYAAACVAALDVQTRALAQQVKAGDESQRRLLLSRLLAGTAFVGDTLLHGQVGEADARRLADAAAEEQKALPPAELAARQASCAAEGTRLFAAANALQKSLLQRLAKRRMGRLISEA